MITFMNDNVVMNFIIGVIIVAVGALGVRYNQAIVEAFGQDNWFERRLGRGSTFPVFMTFAIIVVLFGFFTMVSLHDNILRIIFAPVILLFGGGGLL